MVKRKTLFVNVSVRYNIFFEKWEGGSNLCWSLIYSGARKGHKESQNQANRDYFFIAVGNPSNHIDFVNLKHLMLIGNFLVF